MAIRGGEGGKEEEIERKGGREGKGIRISQSLSH
jgi:hypothetical protein